MDAVVSVPKKSPKKKSTKLIVLSEPDIGENVIISSSIPISQPIFPLESDKEYLKKYLDEIKGTTQSYKRVCLSPLRYAGGKSKAIGLILQNLPALKEKKIVSPFFGGGSVEFVLSSKLGFEVIGYDIFSMLTNFWNQAITNPNGLADELSKFTADKDHYTKNRHILLNYWDKIKPSTLVYNTRDKIELTEEQQTIMDNNDVIQAAYYYYNMQLSYGPMFLGWASSIYMNKEKYTKIIENIRNFNPMNVKVRCDTFDNVIVNHPNDFLFLDPPYFLEGDSKMFKGMYPNCNFAIHHNNFDHKLLCDLLKNHKGGFLLTYNDCSTIREWYKDFKLVYPKWQYTYGQGETRIGKNRQKDSTDNIKESHEIFVICYPSS